jgi:hypothetical protein
MRVERAYRGLPLWLARDYLIELGGESESNDGVRGENWRVTLCEGEPIAIGALRIGQIQIIFEGDDATLARVVSAFEKKALRAGG